ncbi:putative nuclease YhcG [Trichonephila clavata]|uniref:Putative nuclease YhcG n=1 Tax=Trichonephila clavata TaxID=2740835 RepID=A0A8X6HMN9_TRICU|nr:putative nuclease YhcG [Trichonephila clavata]
MAKIIAKEYTEFLEQLKEQIATSRYKAALVVNSKLIVLYHHIGTEILKRQKEHGWGAKIIDQLSKDLRSAFPEMKGFSPRNLKYMRKFAEEYSDIEFVQEPLAQLTWYHNVTLLEKIESRETRLFYIKEAIEHGWSRNIMVMQIELGLHKRQGKAITNFKEKLPSPQSDLAHYTLKDPYIFDFLSIGKDAHEREVEKGLVGHVEKFLLELGEGFAFVGRQFHLDVGNKDFYIDLLFYHLKLRCFIVIELKDKDFKPEYAGKMNFYLSAVDDLLKHSTDQPSIGLILCKSKDDVLAKYTLKDINKPIGLAEYQITENLPEEVKTALPTIEELEAELSKVSDKENLEHLHSRSRRKNSYAANIIDTIVSNSVGTGIKPQSKAKDAEFRKKVQELWLRWTDEADSSGVSDFYGLQALVCRSMIEGGECFVRLRTRKREDGLCVPLQLQVLESEHLDNKSNQTLANGNVIRNGIEFNRLGQREDTVL